MTIEDKNIIQRQLGIIEGVAAGKEEMWKSEIQSIIPLETLMRLSKERKVYQSYFN